MCKINPCLMQSDLINIMKYIPTLALFMGLFIISIYGHASNDSQYDLTMHVISSSPLGYHDPKTGKIIGVHWDVIGELAKRSGLTIKRKLMPYKRIWKQMQTGGHDGGLVWRSNDRDAYVNYVHIAFRDYITALTVKNNDITSYADLYSKKIGKMRSLSISERFNNDARLNITEINKYDNSLRMLLAGRLDIVVGNVHAYYMLAGCNSRTDHLEGNLITLSGS